MQKTYYEVIGNLYGRFLLLRQPGSFIVDSGTDPNVLNEEKKYIERIAWVRARAKDIIERRLRH